MKKLIFGLAILFTGIFAAAQNVTIKADTVSGATSTQVIVPIRVSNFTNIIGMQGTISWNPAIATFDTIQAYGLPSFTIANFGLTQIGTGKVTFSWNDPTLNGITKTNNAIVFELVFNVTGSGGSSTAITFGNTPTAMEFTDNTFNVIAHTTKPGKINVTGTSCNNVTIYADTVSGNNGTKVTVKFKVKNFTNIIGMQGTFSWTTSVATFDTINTYGLPSMSVANFGLGQQGTGKITFSWNDPTLNGVTLSNGTIVWQVVYDVVGSGGTSTAVSFVNTPTSLEFTDNTFNVIAHCTNPGQITATGAVTCNNPSSLSASAITQTTATLNWTSSNPGATYTVEYGPTGFTPGTGTSATGTSVSGANSKAITGLTAATAYQFYVKENCGGTNSSNVGPQAFTTSAAGGCTGVTIYADTVSGNNGTKVTVKFKVKNFTNIIGMQGTFSWTTSVATFDTINTYGLPSMSVANFGLGQQGTGKITFSWNDPTLNGVTLSNGTVVWQVVYDVVGSGGASTAVSFVNTPTSLEFTDNTFNVITHCTSPGQITASGAATCNNPASLSASAITQTTVTLNWTSSNPGATYTVEYGPTGFTPGTGTAATGTSVSGANSKAITGLTAGTAYQFYVKENCGGTNSSNVGPQAFTTTPAGSCTGVTIYADTVSGNNGTKVTVKFKVKNFTNIIGMQGTFSWTTSVVTFDTINTYGLPSMSVANFGLGQQGTGKITFSWNDPTLNGVTLANGTVVWQVVYDVVGSGGASTTVDFVNTPTSMEFTDNTFNVITHCTNTGLITVTSSPCPDPSGLSVTGVTQNSGVFNWTSANAGATYTVEYGPAGFTPGTGTTATGTSVAGSNSKNLTGLNGGTTYDVYVKENCSGPQSSNVGPVTFTACVLISAGFITTINGLGVAFTDTSTNSPTSWNWNFGDGFQSTNQNPVHQFQNGGTFPVCLIASHSCDVDTICKNVTVAGCPAPQANFTFTTSGLTANFTNTSSGTGTLVNAWTFGDGGNSATQNPSHTYSAPGTYTVCLNLTDNCGSQSKCQSVTVNCAAPVAAFTKSNSGLSVTFTNTSTGSPATWAWTFGDGLTSASQSPVHVYPSAGTYTACLTAGSVCGSDTACQTVVVICPLANAAFNSSSVNLTTTFSNTSTGTVTSWSWIFGDGNGSSLQNPVHTYQSAGTVLVCLTAFNSCGSDSACKNVTVTSPCPKPVAAFSNSVNALTAIFSDLSSNTPTAWFWNFGDAQTSNTQSPAHTYSTGGTYTVCLIATNACGSDTGCSSVTVSAGCTKPVTSFNSIPVNLLVNFVDQSTNLPATWSWTFGDATSSVQQNPVHTYSTAGTYNVCLISGNACGNDTSCSNVTVTSPCPKPGANFNSSSSGLTATFTDLSSASPTSWNWNFGDAQTSASQSPSHTYSSAGTYTVCMIATNSCGSDTTCVPVTVSTGCNSPVANFNSIPSGLTVNFVDQSSNSPAAWSWNFGDATSSASQNPVKTYSAGGTYNVCLIVNNSCGNDTLCKSVPVSLPCPKPVANFSNSKNGLVVAFTDISSGSPTLWSWNFGDATTSALQNPTKTYSTAGTYNVCLIAVNSCGSDTTCISVTVALNCSTPVANFTFLANNLAVSFLDQSSNSPTGWSWNFGDATSSALQNPSKTYSGAGTYNVCLTATNACGNHTKCSNVTVTVPCPKPVSNFTTSVNALTATFTDISTNTPTAWAWNFGDATTSALQNPVKTYSSSGTYNVCLIATNSCGGDTTCIPVTVTQTCSSPVANFTFLANNLAVSFLDQTTNSPASWSWTFGDATTSNQQNPSKTYSAAGTYNVCLTATNGCGNSNICKNVTVSLPCPKPVVNFNSAVNQLVVTFTDLTTNNPTAWAWNFGDATTSALKNPVKTYSTGGTYNVCLIATNSCGSDTSCSNVTVTTPCPKPVANFGSSINQLTVTFSDGTTNNPTSWSWNFGDASTSAAQNPTKTYSGSGTFNVCLIAANSCGSDTSCSPVTVTAPCPKPVANFGSSVNQLIVTFSDVTTNNPTAWSWNFGDATTSAVQNPAKTYSASGTYNVCLIATNSCGSDTACSPVTVTAPCPKPATGFVPVVNGLTVNFTDVSSNSPTAWAWNFGDASTSALQNPSHNYSASGTYNVCLIAINSCGSDTGCVPITVVNPCPAPVAAFSFVTNNLSATFTDASTGGAASWSWNFGDATTSALQNPVKTYSAGGTFNVCLIVTTSCGSKDTLCKNVTVSAGCSTPVAAFTASGTGFIKTFLDNSSNSPTSWSWDFGDGGNSVLQSPVHNYAASGTYLACLTIVNACGNDSSCQVITINCPLPNPTFQPTNTSGLTWSFLDQTANNPTTWSWTFGDGGVSSLQNPSHTYLNTGLFMVCLTAGSACGTKSFCQQINVICPQPSASFTHIVSNNVVTFTNVSMNASSSFWTFGDGLTDTSSNPVHTYSGPGNYTVCLTVTNACGQNSFCNSVTVTCPALAAIFTFSASNLAISFTDQSTGTPISWFWNFGDGNTSPQNNPVHTFAAAGTYTVCLSVDNGCNSNTSCQQVVANCPLPTGGFNFTFSNLTYNFSDQSLNLPLSWAWDFGDGTFSGTQNPSHTYAFSGNFNVCLISTNECGDDTTCQQIHAVGVDEDPFDAVEVYPNPAQNELHIRLSLSERTPLRITLRNALGVTAMEIEAGASGEYSGELDVSEIASGVYFLEIQAGESRLTRKVVVE